MGVGKIFSRVASWEFLVKFGFSPRNFHHKFGEIWFLPLVIEKTTCSVGRVRTIQCSVQLTEARFRHQLHLK